MDRGGLKALIFLLFFEAAFSLRMIIGMFCISSSPADASSFTPSRADYDTVSGGEGWERVIIFGCGYAVL